MLFSGKVPETFPAGILHEWPNDDLQFFRSADESLSAAIPGYIEGESINLQRKHSTSSETTIPTTILSPPPPPPPTQAFCPGGI
jgi:hypothetical protein